jgi:hypothetical protein
MELIKLTADNCTVKAISHRNNLLVTVNEGPYNGCVAVMHKKYFNQISAFGFVDGRLRHTEDGLLIFEGFSFR